MSDNSQIEWTDATWNPLRGCSRVSQGCVNCYAETVAARFSGPGLPYEGLVDGKNRWNGTVKLVLEKLDEPLRWRRPRRVFVNSMADLFHESVPFEYIAAVFGVMAAAPHHTFQVLTKRPERALQWFEWAADMGSRMREGLYPNDPISWTLLQMLWRAAVRAGVGERRMIGDDHETWPLPNVWLGVSVEDQRTADERIPWLLGCPAAVWWVSAEPLLGPVDMRKYLWPVIPRWPRQYDSPEAAIAAGATVTYSPQALVLADVSRVNWVVVGGESGPGARPMHPQWARTIRDACVDSATPFFFKQWGEWADAGDAHELAEQYTRKRATTRILNLDGGHGFHGRVPRVMSRVGKRAAGRLLDGRTWDEFPR